MIQLPGYQQLNITAFSSMFKNMQNSYKLFWFKSIFDSIIDNKTILSNQDLINRMIEISFPLIHTYKLNFGGEDQLESMLKTVKDDFTGRCNYQSICKHVSIDKEVKFRNEILDYVPYRLLSVFYSTTVDHLKNKKILRDSLDDEFAFYKIDLPSDQIVIHSLSATYILSNQNVILSWYKYHLIGFLQRRNPSIPNIPFKVDSALMSRKLHQQQKYWNFAMKENPILNYDIYVDETFTNHSILKYGMLSLDHVIPFDFVMHNELWNLTPAHRNVNSAKNNKLPSLDHIYEVANLNYDFFKTIQIFYPISLKEKHPLEDYENLNPLLNYKNHEIHRDDFTQILSGQLTSLHTIAKNQGFSVWENFTKLD